MNTPEVTPADDPNNPTSGPIPPPVEATQSVVGVCTVVPSSGAILQPFSFVCEDMALKEGWLMLTGQDGVVRLFPNGYNGRIVIAPHTTPPTDPSTEVKQ